jgi:hypothetical protein
MNFANKRFKNLKLQLKKKTKKKIQHNNLFSSSTHKKKNQFNMMFTDLRVFVEWFERGGKREQI